MTVVSQLLVGPPGHGVVKFGLDLDAVLRQHIPCAQLRWIADAKHAPICLVGRSQVVHTQFTDRLFGANAAAAASAFVELAMAVRDQGSALTATLHDVPQPSDGAHHATRATAYRSVAACCDHLVVSSEHERKLLEENNIGDSPVSVIPLPIDPNNGRFSPRSAPPVTLGLFGFLYPGKGHHDVIVAADGLPPAVEIHALGAVSPGHDDLVEDLQRTAARLSRSFVVSGHIPDRELLATLCAVTVPITAHRHISASGSLNTWLSAGRRPLAPVTRYTSEVQQRNPGCLLLFEDTEAGLRHAIRHALLHPSSTWLPSTATLRPSPTEAAAGYADIFRSLAR